MFSVRGGGNTVGVYTDALNYDCLARADKALAAALQGITVSFDIGRLFKEVEEYCTSAVTSRRFTLAR